MPGRRITTRWLAFAASAASLACAGPPPPPPDSPSPPRIDDSVYRRAESERADRLEREVERLRGDLRRAEEALIEAESGLRGQHSRADAISGLASMRIRVERAARLAPWRGDRVAEAREKLDEASQQVEQGHYGAALFFVYRAGRVADELMAEASRARTVAGALTVRGDRVNLRAGPSTEHSVIGTLKGGSPAFPEERRQGWVLVRTAAGRVGWVYGPLLEPASGSGGPAAPH